MAIARHRYGPQFLVQAPVDSATAIQAGDALFLDGDDAKPASAFTWGADLAATQASFANSFLGIAQADHPAGSGDVMNFPVDVAPTSVYEMACSSQSHELGDTLGPAKDSGNALLAATLAK